jgi:hypothetical protein
MKICIYTCITGDYEELNPYTKKIQDIDLICLTDSTKITSDVWDIHEIDLIDHGNLSRSQRHAKCCPHLYSAFKNYDIVIYIDNRVTINKRVKALVEDFVESGSEIGLFTHHYRSTLYEEFEAVRQRQIDSNENVTRMFKMALELDPALLSSRPFWGGFIIRRMDRLSTHLFGVSWFCMVSLGSRRDQLSLPIALALSNLVPYQIQSSISNIFKSSFHSWPTEVRRKGGDTSTPLNQGDNLIEPLIKEIDARLLLEKLAMEQEYVILKEHCNSTPSTASTLRYLFHKLFGRR